MMSNHKAPVGKKPRMLEEEFLKDEQYFATNLFEIAQVIVLILDAKGKIVRFNPYMEELSGYRLAEVQGKDWFTTFLPKRDQDRIRKLFLKAVSDIQTHGDVNAIVTKTGQERMISWYDKAMKDSGGKIIGLLCTGIDITERLAAEQKNKRTQETLYLSEERYRSLLESSDDPIYLIDKNLKYLFANNKFLKRLGKSLDEVVGQEYQRFHPDSIGIKEFSAKIEQVYKHRKPISYEHKSKRDGRTFIRTLSPVIDTETETVTAVTVISKDITKRKLAEEEITKLAKFPSENPEPVMRLNDDGTVLYANKVCDSLLINWGWKRGEKVPKYWRNILGEVIEKGTIRIIEAQSGEKIYSFSLVPVVEAKYVNLYGRDITDIKIAENALLNSERMLRRLREHTEEIVDEERRRISQIIHDDLGQRLTGLRLDLESLKQDLTQLGKILSSYTLRKINNMDASIKILVDRIRLISTEIRPTILDDLGLSAAIRWKVREFKEHSNISCMFYSVPKNIALNPRQNITFFRIFTEALTNISRHAEASNVHIRLTQTPQSAILKIYDNGKGMSEQTIISNESLGIYSMRERAHSLGAKLNIDSKPGKGTTITVVLESDVV